MSSQLADGDTTLLAETHAVSSGLKSYVSNAVVEGVEVVRRAMGGHGFMDAAGVGRIYATNLPSATYEGDNLFVPLFPLYENLADDGRSILNLQVARAALKTLASLRQNPSTPLSPSSAYFTSLTTSSLPLSPSSWFSHPVLLQVISLRAALQVQRLERLLGAGKKFGDLSHECTAVSRGIVEAFLVRRMLEAIDNEEEGLLCRGVAPAEKAVVQNLIHFVRPPPFPPSTRRLTQSAVRPPYD